MDAETERKLREHLARTLGREVTEDEWASLLRAAGETPPAPPAPVPRAVRVGRAITSGVMALLVWIVGPLLVGGVVYGLLLGLLWAYHPSGLEDEDEGFLVGAWFTGFLLIGAAQAYPRATAVVGGLGLVLGGVALAIGALIQAAG